MAADAVGGRGGAKPKSAGESWSKRFRAWLESLVAANGPLGTYGAVSLSVLLRRVAFCETELRHLDEHIRALARVPRHAAAVEAVTERKADLGACEEEKTLRDWAWLPCTIAR